MVLGRLLLRSHQVVRVRVRVSVRVRVRVSVRVRVRVRLKISQHHHWYAHSHLTSRIVHHTGCDGILPLGVWKPTASRKMHSNFKNHLCIPHLTKRRSATLHRKSGTLVPVPLSSSPQQLVEQVGMIRLCAYTVMWSLVARL